MQNAREGALPVLTHGVPNHSPQSALAKLCCPNKQLLSLSDE